MGIEADKGGDASTGTASAARETVVRLFEGRFGRLVLSEFPAGSQITAHGDPAIVMPSIGGDIHFLNPGEIRVNLDATRAIVFHAATDWLRESFPAAFGA